MRTVPVHVFAKDVEAGQFRLIGPMVIWMGGGGGAVGSAHATANTAINNPAILERRISVSGHAPVPTASWRWFADSRASWRNVTRRRFRAARSGIDRRR